jgi:hypothetical protein
MKVGMLQRKSSKVWSLIAPLFCRNLAHGKMDEILSRVVYEELGGDPFFFNTVDEFHSLHNISQALRTM